MAIIFANKRFLSQNLSKANKIQLSEFWHRIVKEKLKLRAQKPVPSASLNLGQSWSGIQFPVLWSSAESRSRTKTPVFISTEIESLLLTDVRLRSEVSLITCAGTQWGFKAPVKTFVNPCEKFPPGLFSSSLFTLYCFLEWHLRHFYPIL